MYDDIQAKHTYVHMYIPLMYFRLESYSWKLDSKVPFNLCIWKVENPLDNCLHIDSLGKHEQAGKRQIEDKKMAWGRGGGRVGS